MTPFKEIPRRMMIGTLPSSYRLETTMSQQEIEQPTSKRHLATKSTLLILLIIGLAASAVAYELGLALAANAQTTSQSTTDPSYGYSGYGPRPWGGHPGNGNCTRYGSGTSFTASSRVANVTVTGFNIASANQVTVNLSYTGAGSAPAVTIGAVAPGLAGSMTLATGWSSSTTVTLNLTGSGSLITMRHVAVIVLPYTA